MMNRKEFYEYVKDNVKEYLPESYKDAEIKLQEVVKNNGLKLTGITIPKGNQRTVPTVYLDSLYQKYVNGKDADSCVGDVADMRIEAQDKAEFIDMGVPDIFDYEKMKDKLQVRICDREWNEERLAENLLHEKLDIEAIENPMFCLTNTQKMNGASLLLQEDIRKQIGECLGSDYFVLPSSIHEVLILPDNGMLEVPELNAMVKEVNETQVERQEQLSDKVQFCDGKTAVMENAERRETRLEKAKEAEKVTAKTEAKGGIHGKLEKAKAEIKAKGADTIPKDKAKDLATVL